MKSNLICFVSLIIIGFGYSYGQLVTTRIERLPITGPEEWYAPIFSPNGKKIYFTNSTYNGIWEYTLSTKRTRLITSDQGSGYGFTLSADGKQIAYRKTYYPNGSIERIQEIIIKNLRTLKSSLIGKGTDLSTPTFSKSGVVYTSSDKTVNLSKKISSKEVSILGIENTKIALNLYGEKILLDPFGNGSYIWPSLSPDKTKIVAYEMDRGTFICDLKGKILDTFGRRDHPVWTRDGKWLIFMDDKDDGHQILSSEIMAISIATKEIIPLTSTPNIAEMNPSISPVKNKIICNSYNGELFLISYEERLRDEKIN